MHDVVLFFTNQDGGYSIWWMFGWVGTNNKLTKSKRKEKGGKDCTRVIQTHRNS